MEELRHYEQVVNSTQDAVLSKDLDGVLTSWNPAAERLYGYSAAEAVGEHISLLIPADHANEEVEILDRVRRGERVETYETERVRKDGVRVDVSLTISPIVHPEQGIVGASVIARDITSEQRRRRAREFLLAASRSLDSSLDVSRTGRTIVETAVPDLAEFCVLDFVRPDGWIGDCIVGAVDRDAAAALERVRRESPLDPEGDHPVAQVLRAGEPMVWRDLTSPQALRSVVQSAEHRQLIDHTRYQSAAVAPLIARGAAIGTLSLLHAGADLRYEDEDLLLLAELADRAAVALDNARLFEERARIAQNLQRGLRPPEPPFVAGLDISVVFEAFGEGMEVGGDVYDILPTEDGCWILIADVAGKGSVAAGVSVALRHSARGLARQVDDPRELLGHLNEMLLEGPGGKDLATALLLRLRRDGSGEWRLALAAAGHPPAIHVSAGSPALLGGGAVLGGWEDPPLSLHNALLRSGETLVLATDGWLEAGPVSGHVGPEALAQMADSLGELELAEMTERLRQDALRRGGGQLRDDLVLLAVRPGA